MKKTVLIVIALFFGLNAYSQLRRDRMGNPVVNREPSEQDIEKRKRQIEERKEEYIANFLTTLEADDFQKEIIRQHLVSYYDEKMIVLKTPFERSFEREEAIKKLDNSHFRDLETLISEKDMTKIKELIKGDFDEKKAKNKRKKRKRRKNKE